MINPYIKDFNQICNIFSAEVDNLRFFIDPHKRPSSEHWRWYNYSLTEVSVLRDSTAQPAQLVLHKKRGGFKVITEVHRSKDPLHFVLFFPFGTKGWHSDLKQKLAGVLYLIFQNLIVCSRHLTPVIPELKFFQSSDLNLHFKFL